MCLVAYLSAFGDTFGMASFAVSVLGALAVISVVLAVGFALWRAPELNGVELAAITCDERIGRSSREKDLIALRQLAPTLARKQELAWNSGLWSSLVRQSGTR